SCALIFRKIGSYFRRDTLTGECESAAHAHHLAGDVVGLRAGEEQYSVRDFLRFGEAPEGDGLEEGLAQLLRAGGKHRRIGRTRTYAIDVDRVSGHLARERLGESNKPTFGAGINGLAAATDASGVAGNVDDLAAVSGDHWRQQRLGQMRRTGEVDSDHA